jgi:uncharacterized phage protein (TIGR01671 family)
MNRFKFRIWDKHKNEFLKYPCMVNHLDCDEFFCFERYFKMSEEDCTMQQWTGLFDKNKNPIYEGDLVKIHLVAEEIGEIIFERGGFCCCSKTLNGTFLGIVESGFRIEIIGNIFETPELLETK